MSSEYSTGIRVWQETQPWQVRELTASQERYKLELIHSLHPEIILQTKVRDARVTVAWNVAGIPSVELRENASRALSISFDAAREKAKGQNLALEMWDRDQIVRKQRRPKFLETGDFYVELASHPVTTDHDEVALELSLLTLSLMSEWMDDVLRELYPPEMQSFEFEGASQQVLVNRYERSKTNREMAILIHGLTCNVCGMNFEGIYGKIGAGFIHVHHLERISDGGNRPVDPKTDLITVCPNCHAMLHKKTPPLDPAELREIIVNL
jgi:predicted HNH restriction endonuclease